MAATRSYCLSVLYFVTCHLLCFSLSSLLTSGFGVESQFAHYRTFRPSVYHSREKRQLHQRDGHVNDLSVAFSLDNDSYILDLRLHKELLPDAYFEKYSENGQDVFHKKRDQLCQYQGHIRHVPNSWAALSTCAGLSGVIFDGSELLYIEPRNSSSLDDEHLILKHSDLLLNLTCGTHSALPHSSHDHPKVKREIPSVAEPLVRGPFKANSRSRYVELVLVVDNKSYENQDKDLKRIFRRCKDIANIVNALYAPLNIFIALVGIVVWSEKDEIQISVKGDETLTNFLYYRRVRLAKEHPNDNAQLLTGIQFQGGVVGKALKGPMCTFEFSGGVAMDHSPTVGLVATTVAHEMGHNFGMEHDNDTLCHCPDDKCIMAASSSAVSPTHWSTCSLENLALAFEHGMDYCLRNKPISLFESPECGNMFVEEGEECDCGLPEHCDNPCCNPATCKLHVNATCAVGECCDTTSCRVKNAGSMCRSALQECDLPEYCTGVSEYCPKDLFKMDGISCGQDKAYCYGGSCRSHSDQCRLLWGPSGKGSDAQCYKQNTHGNKTGNCGYTKPNETFIKCLDENINCGLLHCSHLNERLEFGMESVAILSHSFFNVDGKIIPCRTANVDLGLQDVDPGLVPNGAKCGNQKMCVNQTCVPVSSVVKAGCPQNCNRNGECNNLGKCHCKAGFAPPFCDYPGPGGSLDGGPASDPNVTNTFVVAMFIIFLGIVPICAILFCCWYFCRDRRQRAQLWAKIQGAPKLSLPTRGSPDFTQPPSSSNSSSNSSPSGHTRFPRRLFWPVSQLWGAKSTTSSAEDPSSRSSNGLITKVEISGPMPMRPMTKQAPSPVTNGARRPNPPSSLAKNLAGQYQGFTLSPLNEQPDSSFDAVEQPVKKESSVVKARANFFSNGSTAPTIVPVRPAPAAPIRHSIAVDPAPVHPHTEITITKTIVPSSKANETIVIKEVTRPTSPKTNKSRPLSTPNAYSVKAIFNRPDPASNPPAAPSSTTSTLQRVTSLFKSSAPAQVSEPVVTTNNDVPDASGGTSTLPRNQSIKATKINRESLRQLEISAPIPQSAIDLPSKVVPVRPAPAPPPPSKPADPPPNVSQPPPPPASIVSKLGVSSTLPRLPKGSKVHFADEEDKSETDGTKKDVPAPPIVERSESMRLRGVTNRPSIPQFGSMRGKRPLSMPFARPTSPPPNPPGAISPVLETEYSYDDCSKVNGDAIYASIEELQDHTKDPLLKRDETGSTTTSNSDGLLSEIVSELKKKNLDEMYSVAIPKKPLPAIPTSSTPSAAPPTKVSEPKPTVTTSAISPKTVTPKPLSMTVLTKVNTTPSGNAAKPSVPVTTVPAPTPVTTAPSTYKPYSSAWRSWYTSSTTSSAIVGTSSAPVTCSSGAAATTAVTSVISSPKMSTFSSSSSTVPVPSLSTPKSTTPNPSPAPAAPAKSDKPVPLPTQPPVGKLPSAPTSTAQVETKRPLSPKLGVSTTAGISKSKTTNSSKAVAIPKALPAKTVTTTGAPTKAANPKTSVSTAPTPKATTTSSVSSTSSLGGASTTSSGKPGSAPSSLVQSMQQKFDASNKPNNKSVGNGGVTATTAAKGKATPKR